MPGVPAPRPPVERERDTARTRRPGVGTGLIGGWPTGGDVTKILLIDDDLDHLDITSYVLRREGFAANHKLV